MVEVQALAGYMECGGIQGNNLRTLEEVDCITRGGRDLFLWGLDGNVPPEAWNDVMVGKQTWLEFMNAELITVQNSAFTCRGQQGTTGGSNIDYFIVSRGLVPLIRFCGAVFNAPWGPHFGLTLKLFAKPSEVLIRTLIQPTLPRGVIAMRKPKPQIKKENVECKIARREAKEKDTDIEMAKQAENAERWGRIFLETPLEATAFDAKEPLQKSMIEYAEQMGIPTEGNALTDNMARWGKTLSAYV